jgi:hypothetical protein
MLKLINELGAEAVFDPETLRILTAAFDAAWASIEATGTPFSDANYAETAREIIGKHIIKAAESGQRDQQQLRDGALLQLARSDLKRRHKSSESPVHDAGRPIGAPARPLCRDLDARRRG